MGKIKTLIRQLKEWRLNMVLKNDHYTYRVTWSEDDNEYVGLCTEFPGLSWLDESPESALKGIRDVINVVVQDLQENDETIPVPIASRNYSGKFIIRILPEAHRNLAIQAAEAGVSMNRMASLKLSS